MFKSYWPWCEPVNANQVKAHCKLCWVSNDTVLSSLSVLVYNENNLFQLKDVTESPTDDDYIKISVLLQSPAAVFNNGTMNRTKPGRSAPSGETLFGYRDREPSLLPVRQTANKPCTLSVRSGSQTDPAGSTDVVVRSLFALPACMLLRFSS